MTTWLLAGASGFLGTALRVRLATDGDEVVRLVRREPAALAERRWDPEAGELDPAVLDGVDAVVDLGGVNVFTGRWTQARREAILASRVQTTSTVAKAVAARGADGPVLIQAGGVAWYGGRRTEVPHVEGDPAASDFLAQVCVRWEEAAQPAVDAGARVVFLRTSPVLDASGGPFLPMRLAWSLGLGTVLGSGDQRMPLISLADYLGVVRWAQATPHARGPYNLTIPEPCTNAEFTDALARALHRPRLLRAPAAVLRAALGELSGQLLDDMWVLPRRLQDDGYVFTAPDVTSTIAAALRGASPHV
ncbi:TIGR01777 family oxidoreductase [Microlunatus spumicola]|uniref:TIGR01777 family oxidoreductase n=1 Tax=Microlunatus spumicola TaxID=81499 RepID=A0ABP6X849_9ACTN